MLCLIYATNNKDCLGKDNKLLYHNPEDLQFFKRVTYGHTVVMGRKTRESLGKNPLNGRINIVLSRQFFNSTEDALDMIYVEQKERLVFIIGGAEIFKLFQEKADMAFITKYDDFTHGDIYFSLDTKLYTMLAESSEKIFENIPYKREVWVNINKYGADLTLFYKETQKFAEAEVIKIMEEMLCLT